MVRCPHCDQRSISPLRKLLSSRSTPVECPNCNGLSATPVVFYYQFVVAVIYLAIFPNILTDSALHMTDIAVLAVIFTIKFAAPMTKF